MKIYTLTLDDTTFYDPLLENVVSMLPDDIEDGEVYKISCCDMTEDEYFALDEFGGF